MAPIQTRTASIALDADGIVVVRIGEHEQTLDDAKQNLAGAIAACAARKRPLLIDLQRARPAIPEVRRYYSGNVLVESFHALAILVDGRPVGRMMGNIYLRIAKVGIPTRLFADEPEARRWLLAVAPEGP